MTGADAQKPSSAASRVSKAFTYKQESHRLYCVKQTILELTLATNDLLWAAIAAAHQQLSPATRRLPTRSPWALEADAVASGRADWEERVAILE